MQNEVNLSIQTKPLLYETSLSGWTNEPHVINYGAILICRSGKALLQVNFTRWQLYEGAVLTLFPNDVVRLFSPSGNPMECDDAVDFKVEMLRYDASMLREASLQMEQTVYSALREDRCRQDSPVVTDIINKMFALLHVYFDQRECACVTQLVLLQLKAFFVGFHEYLMRNPLMVKDGVKSHRVRELFNRFMDLMEKNYKVSRDVAFYASRMNVTAKYLTLIVRQVTNETPKHLIDHYTILQLKMQLAMGGQSVKEIAWEYNFSDVSFFCRYFKRHTGKSPLSLRNNKM